MEYVWASLLVLINTCSLFLIVLGLPGTWTMVLATAGLWWWQGEELVIVSGWVVVVALVLAFVGEVIEFLSGAAGAKKAGGSRWGSVGAIVGALVGAILGTFLIPVPIVGSIVGMCGGAFAFAALLERIGGRTVEESLRSGQGAAVGRFLGILAKLAVGVAIWVVTGVAAFWP